MEINKILIIIALGLGAALLSRIVAHYFRLPMLTGYIIIGIVLGITHVFSKGLLEKLAPIDDIVLALISFSIGAQLSVGLLKKMEKSIIAIVLFEAVGGFIIVAACAYLWTGALSTALILGAIGSATAPAANVVVLERYKAKGPLTSAILATVGMNEAISCILFALAFILSKSLMKSYAEVSLLTIIFNPIGEIILSVVIGAVLGFISTFILNKIKGPDELLIATGFMLLLSIALAAILNLSELLAGMSFGFVIVNKNPFLTQRLVKTLNTVSPVLYALFFVFAGAHLDISFIATTSLLILAFLYIVARGFGKFFGAYLGAKLAGAPELVQKYIGLSLVPQVGVAIVFAVLADRHFSVSAMTQAAADATARQTGINVAALFINILLLTAIITETLGPLLTRWAIHRAGEAKIIPGENISFKGN